MGEEGTGLTLGNVVKIILAIIVLIFIIIPVANLVYQMFFTKQDELQAKGAIEQVYQAINSLDLYTSGSFNLYTPAGWTFVSFGKNDKKIKDFGKPSDFTYKDVICICKKTCKKEICREIKKPLMKDDKLFFWKIDFNKQFKFFVVNKQDIYEVSEKNMDLNLQKVIKSPILDSIIIDTSQPPLEFSVTRYYTPLLDDYTTSSEPSQAEWQEFYNEVLREGSGLGLKSEGYPIYHQSTIKNTKKESTIYTTCADCELGVTSIETDTTIGRTVAVDTSIIPVRSVIYIEFNCEASTCKEECQKWNGKYIAEDSGKGIIGNKIDLYVGAGRAQLLATDCLNVEHNKAKIWLGPQIDLASIKKDDRENNQATLLV